MKNAIQCRCIGSTVYILSNFKNLYSTLFLFLKAWLDIEYDFLNHFKVLWHNEFFIWRDVAEHSSTMFIWFIEKFGKTLIECKCSLPDVVYLRMVSSYDIFHCFATAITLSFQPTMWCVARVRGAISPITHQPIHWSLARQNKPKHFVWDQTTGTDRCLFKRCGHFFSGKDNF